MERYYKNLKYYKKKPQRLPDSAHFFLTPDAHFSSSGCISVDVYCVTQSLFDVRLKGLCIS